MRMRLGMLTGAAVGYVLGTAAGRERYEQIRQNAQQLMESERVQQLKDKARGKARETGETLGEKATESAGKISEKVSSVRSGSESQVATEGVETHTGPPPNLPEGTIPDDTR